MSWVVDILEKPERHRCDVPRGPSLAARKVGSIWECDRCYRQYEVRIVPGYMMRSDKGLVAL